VRRVCGSPLGRGLMRRADACGPHAAGRIRVAIRAERRVPRAKRICGTPVLQPRADALPDASPASDAPAVQRPPVGLPTRLPGVRPPAAHAAGRPGG
jgi:hypothetical protein